MDIVKIFGYQCVVRKGQFKIGDLAIYIYPDSVVPVIEPFRFIWEGSVCEGDIVPERRRRITVRKFRKAWSEGLLLPLSDFPELFRMSGCGDPIWCYLENNQPIDAGDDVSDMIGITHYEPEEKGEGSYQYAPKRKRRLPKTFKGWLKYIIHFNWFWAFKRKLRGESSEIGVNAPRYDVEALKNHVDAFEEGEVVDVTEKIHGSNSRYMWLEDHMYAGSHNLWKAPDSKCIWRRVLEFEPWIVEWCKAHEGYALYGEITPTQKGFDYGSTDPQFFAFDIYTPDGQWVKPWNLEPENAFGIFVTVPYLGRTPFNLDEIKSKYVDGITETLGTHIREGVVISAVDPNREAYGVGRLQLKIVSNQFYERDQKNESTV